MKTLVTWHRNRKSAGRFALALLIANEIRGLVIVGTIGLPLLKAMWVHG